MLFRSGKLPASLGEGVGVVCVIFECLFEAHSLRDGGRFQIDARLDKTWRVVNGWIGLFLYYNIAQTDFLVRPNRLLTLKGHFV